MLPPMIAPEGFSPPATPLVMLRGGLLGLAGVLPGSLTMLLRLLPILLSRLEAVDCAGADAGGAGTCGGGAIGRLSLRSSTEGPEDMRAKAAGVFEALGMAEKKVLAR